MTHCPCQKGNPRLDPKVCEARLERGDRRCLKKDGFLTKTYRCDIVRRRKEVSMLGWHFLKEDRRLGYEDGRLVEAGKTYRAKGKLLLCENGMHASARILDALQYAPGAICCRVELVGRVVEDKDKAVGRARRVIAMVDATKTLHGFACLCAEDALRLVDSPDPRSIAAIQAKRDWLAGKISDAELAAARAAAWAAVRDAAWDATRAAQDKRLTEMIEREIVLDATVKSQAEALKSALGCTEAE